VDEKRTYARLHEFYTQILYAKYRVFEWCGVLEKIKITEITEIILAQDNKITEITEIAEIIEINRKNQENRGF